MSGHPRAVDERGSAAVEAVLLAPVVLLLVLFVVYLGRLSQADARVEHAAAQAARAASMARKSAAPQVAEATARAALDADGVECATLTIDAASTSTAGLEAISVTVRCTIPAGDLAPLAPGMRTVEARSAEVFDVIRAED